MDWYLGTNLHHEVLKYDDQRISRLKSHLFSEIWCGAGKWSNTLVQLWQTSPERFPVKYERLDTLKASFKIDKGLVARKWGFVLTQEITLVTLSHTFHFYCPMGQFSNHHSVLKSP